MAQTSDLKDVRPLLLLTNLIILETVLILTSERFY